MYTRETQELIYAILGDISNFFTGQEAGHSPHRLDLEQTKKQIKERFLEEYDLKPLKSPLVYFSKFLKENRYKTIKEAEKDLKEFKLKILKKEYHSEKDVIRIVSDMNYRIKSKLITIPKKVSILILNKSNQLEVEKILKEEINNVLEELTEYSYQEEQEIGEIDG